MIRFLRWVLLLLCSSCQEVSFDVPLVLTGEVIEISSIDATFTGKITNNGKLSISESGFLWGLHEDINPDNSQTLKNENTPEGVFSLKSNKPLLSGMTYYVRAYVKSESTTTYGEIRSFVVEAQPITVGKWSIVVNQFTGALSGCEFIQSSFTKGDVTYFLLPTVYGDIEIYTFNHTTKAFSFLMTTPLKYYVTISVVHNDVVYIFSGDGMYLFNPTTLSFTDLAKLNSDVFFGTSGFSIGDDIYVGLGSNQQSSYTRAIWRYNIIADSWTDVAPFPGDFRTNPFTFSIHGEGYVGGGIGSVGPNWAKRDLWRYSPETNQWTRKETLRVDNNNIFSVGSVSSGDFGYTLQVKDYGYTMHEMLEYNSTFDIWEHKASLDIDAYLCNPYLFAYDGKIYIASLVFLSSEKHFTLVFYEK